MPKRTRLFEEQQFHDRQARHRADWYVQHPHEYRFPDDAYLDHETWIRPAFSQLGDVAGLPVLDYGCGHGMAAVVLARRGARVTAFDLSAGYVAEARRRAAANGVAVALVQADGERLPFADASFDRIWGNAILHHLDIEQAARELDRVLRPGGVVVFCEPWGGNPLLAWARRHLPYAGKERTVDEEPLGKLNAPTGHLGLRFDPGFHYYFEAVATAARHQVRLSPTDLTDTQRIPPGGTPGYTVFTLRAGYEFSPKARMTFAIENLTDKDYRIHGSGLNEPGTNVVLGMELKF